MALVALGAVGFGRALAPRPTVELLAADFDERDPAVLALLTRAISACKKLDKYVGICGQGPSDHPDLAKWLTEEGISSISLNPDSVIDTWQLLGKSMS